MDIAPFGQVMRWESDGRDYGIYWEDQRNIASVAIIFEQPVNPSALRLEYWQSGWPQRRIPRDQPSGSGSSGWLDVGDWYKGKWQAADARVQADGARCTFTFAPVNAKEFPKLKDFSAEYRTTMKVRVVSDRPLPKVTTFQAFTDSVLKQMDFVVQWKDSAGDRKVEVFNGELASGKPTSSSGKTLSARVWYAQPIGYNSFDETVVTIRGRDTFSFAATDLNKYGHIFIPDLGVLVRKADQKITYADAEKLVKQARQKPQTMDLYSRVLAEDEQTLTRAWKDTPAKSPQYIPLSFEGTRQHFRSDANGSILCDKNWIARLKGKDTPLCKWDGNEIRYSFGLPKSAPSQRGLVDGCLPIIQNEWVDNGVRYRQTAFAMPLSGVPEAGRRIMADDPLVLFSRVEMEKVGAADADANLELSISHGKREKLRMAGEGVVVAEADGGPITRVIVKTDDAPDSFEVEERDGNLHYSARLTAAEPRRAVEARIPYVALDAESDIQGLWSREYTQAFEAVRNYWRNRVAAGTKIVTPEPMINDFYNADVSHLLINTEREVGKSDRYMPKVGTFHYGVYSNESCMMVSDLDRRGYHDVAERALETWLHYQGTVALPGDYSSPDGEFYGAAGYEHGGYNQHHGWVLWCLGEHWWYTRDKAWLDHAAPKIVKGCEWIIRERGRTIEEAKKTPLRAIEKGLLPPGSLEDIGDWRCWLSNNVFSWWGMDNAARAMVSAGHPEGARLLKEAEAYRKDLLAAFTEAMHRSPVVRLRDGSWIPKIPSDVHRRGRSFGWITETLEGSIYLLRTGAIDANTPTANWIVKDYEDNLYLSDQFGYQLQESEFEKRWFSHGGISQQANLLQNPVPYLLRDEVKHYLRAYFNAFAVSYFPDTRMMTEHALPNIGDWRGDHYKSSDESNSTYWLRLIFVAEHGDELWLGQAMPRYWMKDGQKASIADARTYFGPVSMQVESLASRGQVKMTIDPPTRNAPKVIRARLRHPEGKRMVRCEVNGKTYAKFNPEKEWVELSGLSGRTEVVAYY